MSASNLLSQWAWLLIDSLAASGVRDVVISPGSRSTPFVVAVERHPQLRTWDLIDERTAAFFALGQGRAAERPSLLLCTSGTAAAHYLPAVVEARMAATPLLLLTADRPGELIDCGAAQAIDQLKLFGEQVRHFVELGIPDPHPAALRGLRRRAAQAVHRSHYPNPGAVHLNARARKPLEPRAAATAEEQRLEREVRSLVSRPVVEVLTPRQLPAQAGVERIALALSRQERGLIVCGPAPFEQAALWQPIAELARATAYPLLAEATSQLRFTGAAPAGVTLVDGFSTLLESRRFREEHATRVVIQLGRAPVSAAWERYLEEQTDCQRFVLSPGEWHDPSNTADLLLLGDPAAAVAGLVAELGEGRRRSDWQRRFGEANARLEELLLEEIETAERESVELEEGSAVRRVVAALPDGALLAVGNSLPIRELEMYTAGLDRRLLVFSQRGACGIDGLVSGVAGTLTMLARKPAPPPLGALLLGDVSLLHDVGGLAAASLVRDLPFVVVVLNNDGGRIFEQLPIFDQESGLAPGTSSPPARECGLARHWLTPHGRSLEPAAQLFGIPHAAAGSRGELDAALEEAMRRSGPSLVEVRVEAASARRQKARLLAAVEERLAEVAG